MAVEVDVRALAVEAEHEVRCGVEKGAVAALALPQGLDGPFAGEREARCRADRFDQVALFGEGRVVDDGRDDLALVLDEGRRLPFSGRFLARSNGRPSEPIHS